MRYFGVPDSFLSGVFAGVALTTVVLGGHPAVDVGGGPETDAESYTSASWGRAATVVAATTAAILFFDHFRPTVER